MRRGARRAAAVALLLAACRPPGPPPTVEAGLPSREPAVRIGVAVDVPEVEVGAAGDYELVAPGGDVVERGRAGDRWTIAADGNGRLTGRRGGNRFGPIDGPITVRPRGDGAVVVGGKRYRGGALVRSTGPRRVTAINTLDLEAYLLGVVPREIGKGRSESELEAVKAQAVAARTYAIGHLGRRERLGFDFYATVADQVYGGLDDEDPIVSRAVRETRGEILTYDGVPILAYYHSTCGGRTAAVEEVWNRAPLPYLKSVSDRIGRSDRYYCDTSNRFRWSESWTGEQLRAILRETLSAHTGRNVGRIDRVEEVAVEGHTPSGRVRSLRIRADGSDYVVRGDSVRWVLRPEPGRSLNSALFVVDRDRRRGEVTALRVSGAGWGHGIGMCQVGALGRARAGQDYGTILRTYYRGTELVRLY